ncbi:hypothetical protein H5410_002900, partial [Solanum commersonii]
MHKVYGVTSEGIVVPDQVGYVADVSVDDVWITECTIVSTISRISLNIFSSRLSIISSLCTAIYSSS